MKQKIFFWQPLMTDHAVHTFMAAAVALNREPQAVVDSLENETRKKQGWSKPADVMPITKLPKQNWRNFICNLIDENPSALHIIGSPFEISRISYAVIQLLIKKRCVFLVSEPFAPGTVSYFSDKPTFADRIKGFLRPQLYQIYGMLIRKRISGIFAISPLSVRQFAAIGLPHRKIFPFGYFVPSQSSNIRQKPATYTSDNTSLLRMAFVGSLITRKGVSIAIDAVSLIQKEYRGAPPLLLDVFGPGEIDVPKAAVNCPVVIRYKGLIPFGCTQAKLEEYDLLIVPSLHDGWAVVVNEAIQAGCAVITSRSTGASGIIAKWHCGELFESGNATDLANVITKFLKDRKLLEKAKEQSRIMRELLEPQFAGKYMADVITSCADSSVTPKQPWF